VLGLVLDAAPYFAGSLIETALFAVAHPLDVTLINVVLTVASFVFPSEEAKKFVLGLWVQFALLMLYETIRVSESESLILSLLASRRAQ